MIKKWSKIIAFIMICMLSVTALPFAGAEVSVRQMTFSEERSNPRLEGVALPHFFTQSAPLYYGEGAESEFLTDADAAGEIIREGMEGREASFNVCFSVPEVLPADETAAEARLGEIGFGLVDLAFTETDRPTQGDSLRYCYTRMSLEAVCYGYEERTDIIFTYTPTYFTTKAQEDELSAAVDTLVASFSFTEATTQRQKVDTIYNYMTENIVYDYTNLEDDSYLLKFTAYAALMHKTAVCEGYAVLFYRLAEECGLDARVITGYGGAGRDEKHAWNIVKLDQSYYYLDSTWDAERLSYSYYLKGENDFMGHINDPEFDTPSFRERYPIATVGLTVDSGREYTIDNYTILVTDGQATITKYLGSETDITVPGAFLVGEQTVPVYSIQSDVFKDNQSVQTLTLSEGIYKIGVGAIYNCDSLTTLHLPSTLKMQSFRNSFTTEAPEECDMLATLTVVAGNPYLTMIDGVLYSADLKTLIYCPPANGITQITVPEGVEFVGNSSVGDHKTLTRITLSNTVQEIGYWAFTSSKKLAQLDMSSACETIRQYAFTYTAVTRIDIPAATTKIMRDAFALCYLQSITVDTNNTVYRMVDGALMSDTEVLKYAIGTQDDTCTIPEEITDIQNYAFDGAINLKAVELPSTLETVGQSSFSDCTALVHVTLPDGVTSIGDHAFSGCGMLLSIIIPDSVQTIGESLHHPDKSVTIYSQTGSAAHTYATTCGYDFKTLDQFRCTTGHQVSKVIDEENSTQYTEIYQYICSVCSDHSKVYTHLYDSINGGDVTYALEYTSATYTGQPHRPKVLWVKDGDQLLIEGVHYNVLYGDNTTVNDDVQIWLLGLGNYVDNDYIYFPIEPADITRAQITVSPNEYEYDGAAKYPDISVVWNDQTLTVYEDYGLIYRDNKESGTAKVIITGSRNFTGTVEKEFTILPHQHSFTGGWYSYDGVQHRTKCQNCDEYQYASHNYDDACDTTCNDCYFTRTTSHQFTTLYGFNEYDHWQICDICGEYGRVGSHGGGTATCTQRATCVTCNQPYGTTSEHDWQWDKDATHHWQACKNCTATQGRAEHFGGSATCTTLAECDVCKIAYGSYGGHSWGWAFSEGQHWQDCTECTATGTPVDHSWSLGWDEHNHWQVCEICPATTEPQGHSGGTATCTTQAICSTCTQLYGGLGDHSWRDIWSTDSARHWKRCERCSATNSVGAHSGGTATCAKQAVCATCNQSYGTTLPHQWELRTGVQQHWEGCANCTATRGRTQHYGGTATCVKGAICEGCGSEYGGRTSHSWSNEWNYITSAGHAHNCIHCTAHSSVVGHLPGPPATQERAQTCQTCGYELAPKLTGTPDPIPDPEPQPPVVPQNPFTDNKPSAFYYNAVLWAVENNVTSGLSATTFGPNKSCTRGQVVTFLWRAAGSPEPRSMDHPFVDIKRSGFYYKAVLWAVEQGITNGTDATHFGPSAVCNRGQIVTFLYRFAGSPQVSGANSFRDVKTSSYFYKAVLWASANGITSGTAPGTFSPNTVCTRGQVVTFLYRYVK